MISALRREALRTNLWLVPTLEVLAATALFAVTYALDRAAYHGQFPLPPWMISGTADAARQILTGSSPNYGQYWHCIPPSRRPAL